MQMSFKACSSYRLLLTTFLFHLTFTNHPFAIPLCSSSFFLFTVKLSLAHHFVFRFPVFATIKPLCFTPSLWPCSKRLFPPSLTIICSLDAKCFPYQSHFLIHFFPLAMNRSITHCSTPTFNPLTPSLWWLIPSVTHPHQAQPLPLRC